MPRELVTVGYACSCVVFTDTVVYTLASGTKNCVTLTGQLGVVDDAHVPQRRPARSAGFGEEIDMEFTAIARRLGLFSAAATVVLLAAYAVTLTIGLLSLESPDRPIRNPMFAILEIPDHRYDAGHRGPHDRRARLGTHSSQGAQLRFRRLHGPARWADEQPPFRHPDRKPPAGIGATVVAAARPGVQVALDRLRP